LKDSRWRMTLLFVLLAASLVEFTLRGPLRAAQSLGWNDFLSPYIQAKALIQGKDPYDAQVLVTLWPSDNSRPPWVDKEAGNGTLEEKRGIPSPYPLSTLVVLLPFVAFKWSLAVRLWIVLSTLSVFAALFGLMHVNGHILLDWRSLLFLTLALALAPLHTGVATANPAVLSISLAILSFCFKRSGKLVLAAILLAIAVCLKPTVAGGLLLFFLLRREWKLAGSAAGLAGAIGFLGIARLWLASTPWLASYRITSGRMFGPGSLDDFARFDFIRFNMINGQVFFYSLLRNSSAANLLTWLLALGLFGSWAWLVLRRGDRSEMLLIAAISVLSLIPFYHRFYDATLLIWPIGWAVLGAGRRGILITNICLLLPFLVPGPILLAELMRAGYLRTPLMNRWWGSAVLSHEVLDLILWCAVLLYWICQATTETAENASNAAEEAALRPHSVEFSQ